MFGKKEPKKLSIDELVAEAKALTDEELAEFKSKLDLSNEESLEGENADAVASEAESTSSSENEPTIQIASSEPTPESFDATEQLKPTEVESEAETVIKKTADPLKTESTAEAPTEESKSEETDPESTGANESLNAEYDGPDEGEFYDGEFEDIPQAVKSDCDESALYDQNADSVEMRSGGDSSSLQDESVGVQSSQDIETSAEQGDILAALQAKITALEAENAQMKAKFEGNFGFGNAPSLVKGRYQSRDEFIKNLPQIRKN